jgi:8-amino-7-oxononanoate synthase
MSLQERWAAILSDLRARGRHRSLHSPQGADFSSNDYLGYAGGRLAPACTASPAARSGQSSRLLRGHHLKWDEIESQLARWHGSPAALVMASGYAANEGLLSTVIEPLDWVASDALNHASIIDGLRLSRAERFVYRHADLDHLESGLRNATATEPADRHRFIVTEALFGMDGDLSPLHGLVELSQRYGAHLIVDEAHSTGCFGATGSGCVDAADLRERVLATVHTGGKALGVLGAYVCGSATLRELLINRCRHFIYTTALPPLVATWWLEALPRVAADQAGRTALHEGAAFFRKELSRQGVTVPAGHHIVPVVLGEDERTARAATRLQEAGFDIRAIRPPTVPEGTARLRISVHADHSLDVLAAAAAAVAEVCR